jgi:hypothetical protein
MNHKCFPKPVAKLPRDLPQLSEFEDRVFRGVTGRLSVTGIAKVLDATPEDVARVVYKLHQFQLVLAPDIGEPPAAGSLQPTAPPAAGSLRPTAPPVRNVSTRPTAPPQNNVPTKPPASSSGHDEEDEPPPSKRAPRIVLKEDCDLPPDLQRKVSLLYSRLDAIDGYQLLGVDRDVDRKKLRTAYFDLVAKVHPDRYFGKNLGSYKAKMEQIFARVTREYEAILEGLPKVVPVAKTESEPPPPPRTASGPMGAVSAHPKKAPSGPMTAVAPPRNPSGQVAQVKAPSGEFRMPTPSPAPVEVRAARAPTPEEEKAAREALARRLRGRAPAKKAPAPAPRKVELSAADLSQAAQAAEALRRRYDERVQGTRDAAARHHLQAADAAIARNDLLSAARSLKEAMNFSDDPAIKKRHADLAAQAADFTYTDSMARALEAERSNKLIESASLYARAFDSRPTADAAIKAAGVLKRIGNDLNRAKTFAEQAVQLEPQVAGHRLLLGQIYLDLGLQKRGMGELERAVALDPSDDRAKALITKLNSIV